MNIPSYERVVCLTEEPTEILYLLGEEQRIVGISAYTERPAQAKKDKPVVSAFIDGSVPKIQALKPDLVIGFSDIQAKLASELIAAGLTVIIFNQRSLEEILGVVQAIGRLVGAGDKAADLCADLARRIDEAKVRNALREQRPKVYFEEWPDPMISAIQWVSELIGVAGGTDIFAAKSAGSLASERFIASDDVLAAQPEVMLASWCGKPFDEAAVRARPGWNDLPALRDKRVFEIDPSIILQPGPASILAGLPELERCIHGES
ncbi:MAG: iron complex transport system substrate-binding protein [Pseudohongiellaceae bacterium]|jgi:iron complex transport system substrate-binding protein